MAALQLIEVSLISIYVQVKMIRSFIIFFVITCLPLYAQVEPVDSDRPDFSESATALTPGIFQVESGFVLQNSVSDEEGFQINFRDVSLLSTLLRYGLFPNIELRAGFGYLYQRTTAEETNSAEGINELFIGTKIQLLKGSGSIPDIAILAHLSIPANKALTPSKIEPDLVFAFANDISERFSVSYNLGGTYASEEEKIYYLYAATVEAELTEVLGTFLEFYGEAAEGIKFGKNLDAGFTYLLQDNFQADISAGINLDEAEDNWFLGVGVSIRLPE